jgi:hypothetical protein
VRYIQAITTALAMAMSAALVACSSGSSSTTPPPPPAITVSVSGAPATLAVNGTADVTATVANDSANAGVTWSCAPANSCGTFSAGSTASGTATTYTAPSTVPSSAVTITAASVTDPTKTGTASITITPPAIALADGNYVFSLSGSDSTVSPYFVSGVFTVSGGAITGGEQDFVDFGVVATDLIDATGSSFTTTAQGNLQVTLTTCTGTTCPAPDPAVGVSGVETFNATMISSTRGRIIEFDTLNTSSGTIELQDSTAIAASPAGGYAFAVQGIDGGFNSLAIGGVLSLDGTGALTSSSVFDQNRGGILSTNQTVDTTASSVTGPDASGRVLISLKPTDTTLPIVNFAGYIVDATNIRLAEVADPSGSTTGGTALGQNAANLAVDGKNYVVGLNGFDLANGALQIAGTLNLASGNVTGNLTYNDLVVGNTAAPITGTFVADATGRVTLSTVTDGVNTFNLQLYVDGNGNALSISLDTSQDILEGIGYEQTGAGSFTAGSFSGTYVMAATGADVTSEFELDAVGPVAADGVGAFNGFADLNWISTGTASIPTPGLTVSGAFTADPSGVFAGGTLTGLDVTAAANADAFDYYVVDTTKVIGIEADFNQLTLGYFELTQ